MRDNTWIPDKLPEDLDAEAGLLARLAADSESGEFVSPESHDALLMLRPEYFVKPQHKIVFEAMLALYHGGKKMGMLAMKAELDERKQLERLGGFIGMCEIINQDYWGNPVSLAARLRDLWVARSMIKTGGWLARKAADCGGDPSELLAKAQDALSTLAQDGSKAKIESAEWIIERIRSGEPFCEPGAAKLARFGLPAFDDAIEASAEHVVTVAARPGIGKSAFGVQMQCETALSGIPSLLISLEMNRDELGYRTAAWFTGYEQRAFRSGVYADSVDALQRIEPRQPPLSLIHWWVHKSGVPWPQVEAAIRDAVRTKGVRVVVIDYLLLLAKPDLGKNVNDAACWTSISRAIKRLAQELKICFVNLCQINRAGEGVEPKLSDLKETGGWEEDANAVIMLYPKDPKATEDIYAPKKAIFAKAAKVRSGASGWKKELDFFGAQSRFVEVERETTPNTVPRCAAPVHECML
jgi:replicative DNA helicase